MAHETPWQSTHCWIRLFSWSVLAATVYGLAVAHVPALIGLEWSSSRGLATVLVVHLFEAPIALFNLTVAWFGLRRLTRANARVYDVLLSSLITINAVFFVFESLLVLDKLATGAPAWEAWFTASIVVILLGSLAMGIPLRIALALRLAEPEPAGQPVRKAADLRAATDARQPAAEAS